MKQFLIKYRRTNGSTEDWHREIARFIAGIDADPALAGKVGYRCMKARDGDDYFHIATVHDDSGRVALQERACFKHYTKASGVRRHVEVRRSRRCRDGCMTTIPREMRHEFAMNSVAALARAFQPKLRRRS